ncbi:MAG: Ig-like domain-containing protein, partial [Spirochaetaceae bacterium]|nr:Ig-like domain-containing protein [Spirochaetaceae bacterium]
YACEWPTSGIPGKNVAATGVTVSPATASIAVAATVQLTATVAPSTATNRAVSWSTSASAIATVSSSGLVTGVAAGPVTITATTTDGSFTDTCAVTVTGGGGGGGSAILWYGKANIYQAVAGDNNDIKKYDISDFDYNNNPTNAFLVDGATGEFWYEANGTLGVGLVGNWYKVVAGAGNDLLLFPASDLDSGYKIQYLILNMHLCYVKNDGANLPLVYQVVAGAADTLLYAASEFDNPALANGNQLVTAGGKLYYKYWPGNGYLYEMVVGGADVQKYTVYPLNASDVDTGVAGSTYYGNFISVSGELWHNESYTGFDIWQTVTGTANDVRKFTQEADFDGLVIPGWTYGIPDTPVKANSVGAPLLSAFPECK